MVLNVENELKLVGLTPEKYEEFLQDCGDKINGVSDIDWGEIIEKYNLPYDRRRISESMGRNILGGNFVREFYKNKVIGKSSDEAVKELVAKEQEIYKAKRKLQDERNELNKLLRDEARHEENIRIIEERIEQIGKERYPFSMNSVSYLYSSFSENQNTMIVCLSDLHLGLETPTYNIEIAKERLSKYIKEIKNLAEIYSAKKCVCVALGDLVSGIIHLTIQIVNRENAVNQTMTACELIADFLYKLGGIFEKIEFYSVPGNHSRIEKNADDSLLGEKLDNLVPWFLSHIFAHQEKYYIGRDEAKNTYTEFPIGNKNYLIVHGDWDGISDTSIQKLCAYLGYFPYAILMGHMHHPAMNDVSGVKVIQSGSLFDGDEFTERKRLRGKASQTVVICDDNKIKAICPIELS